MTRRHLRPYAIAGAVAIASVILPCDLAMGEPLMDLHDIAVGMPVQQLPAVGYRDLRCAGRSIAAWSDWASCPVNGSDGLRAVHVAYDQLDGGTKVAGHPVDLTIFFDGVGRLTQIEIRTDDHVPPFLHKKAYMLARQAKAHYGEDGWTCKSIPASQDEESIGSTYINEACTKVTSERHIEVNDRLFRKKGGAPRDFVSTATVLISNITKN